MEKRKSVIGDCFWCGEVFDSARSNCPNCASSIHRRIR
jgi:uncharacterized OB-fold protein